MGDSGGNDLMGILASISALENRQFRIATPTMPLLSLPGTYNTTVNWATPMPTSSYSTYLHQDQLAGKGTATVTAWDTGSVSIRVVNTSLIALGTQIFLIAWG